MTDSPQLAPEPSSSNRTYISVAALIGLITMCIACTFIYFFLKNANEFTPIPTRTPTLGASQAAEATNIVGSLTPKPTETPPNTLAPTVEGASTAAATGATTSATPGPLATTAAPSTAAPTGAATQAAP